MPAVNCKYHPATPARWGCDHCQISFCPGCVTQTNPKIAPECPVCKRQLQSLGTSHMVKPFWLRLREFFIYPAYPKPLILILSLSILAFFFRFIPGWNISMNFLFFEIPRNVIFILPFFLLFLRYAQTVLEDTAHGHLKPTQINQDKLSGNGLGVFKLLGVLFAFFLIEITALDLFDNPGYHTMKVLTAFATPAAIMILTMEDKFFSALNPVMIASVISRIGMSYFIMSVLFYLLNMAQASLFGILLKFIDPSLSFGVYAFVLMYFYIINFNMMGYILYQHHDELGFKIHVEAHEQDDNKQFETVSVSPEMRAVEILIHEGKLEQAVKELQALIAKNPTDMEARDRLLKLSRLMNNKELHQQQVQNYISYLFGENNIGVAARIYESGYEFDKSIRPAKPSERVELAQYFRQRNQFKLAMAVLNDLHRDFPSFEAIPVAYMMVASMLSEQFNDDERAIKILEFLLKNYPSHAMRSEIEEYLKIVKNISGA